MTSEIGQLLVDSPNCVAQPPLDIDASSLGSGPGPSAAPAQTDAPSELAGERVDLGLGLRPSCEIAKRLGFPSCFSQVFDAAAVFVDGALVEQLAGITA